MVRAKFKVSSVTEHLYGKEVMKTVALEPVFGGPNESEENKKFFKWTPSGKVELGTLNPDAAKEFEIGKEYYIDFSKCEESAPKTAEAV